jgi:DUF1680 family protein
MDPITLNRMGQIRHEEILAEFTETEEQTSERQYVSLGRVLAFVRSKFAQPAEERKIGYARQEQHLRP